MPCRLIRLMISHAADAERRVSDIAQRHVARCAACREFHERCRTMARSLRDEAVLPPNAPERQTQQVLAAVGDRPRRVRPFLAGARLAAAACLAVALLGAAVLLIDGGRAPESPPGAARMPAPPNVSLTRVMQNPLETELENLTADTQSGVRFLVACLDVNPAPGRTRAVRP